MAVDNRDSNEGRSNIYEEEELKRGTRGPEEGKQLLYVVACRRFHYMYYMYMHMSY